MSLGVLQPFTAEQVAALEKHQRERVYHPFTCPDRGDGKHGDIDGDTGILVPTVRGWICRYCDYTQDWAHAFMAQPQPVERPHSCKFPSESAGNSDSTTTKEK